jgi:hypothetical protein
VAACNQRHRHARRVGLLRRGAVRTSARSGSGRS